VTIRGAVIGAAFPRRQSEEISCAMRDLPTFCPQLTEKPGHHRDASVPEIREISPKLERVR